MGVTCSRRASNHASRPILADKDSGHVQFSSCSSSFPSSSLGTSELGELLLVRLPPSGWGLSSPLWGLADPHSNPLFARFFPSFLLTRLGMLLCLHKFRSSGRIGRIYRFPGLRWRRGFRKSRFLQDLGNLLPKGDIPPRPALPKRNPACPSPPGQPARRCALSPCCIVVCEVGPAAIGWLALKMLPSGPRRTVLSTDAPSLFPAPLRTAPCPKPP